MATAYLTLCLPEETKAKLDKLAQATHRSQSCLAEEAIVRYLDLEGWQVGEIERAIEEADRGGREAVPNGGPAEKICGLSGCAPRYATWSKR